MEQYSARRLKHKEECHKLLEQGAHKHDLPKGPQRPLKKSIAAEVAKDLEGDIYDDLDDTDGSDGDEE